YKDKYVVPAMNTKFVGGSKEHGIWEERCGLCGDCVLHLTGGICPIIRCSKSILNGPCGGSQYGKCEISKEVDCAWQLIYDRMVALGQLDSLKEIQPPKDWTKSRDGGPRKMTREDVMIG
ncbi:MAG: methylenetetrahydrofolate reductase C-terminal domain-containing protein, partial [Firmicutes bacterium]|nr:methylenetetrahydrofolate reductase C-terminal domain-containing protein [Bacillota bacterium]